VQVPDVVAELAAERLVAGADELERRARRLILRVIKSTTLHVHLNMRNQISVS
jgi:hypothetical protein